MINRKIGTIILLISLTAACSDDSKTKSEIITLKSSPASISVLMDPVIFVDKMTCFRIVPNDPEYKIAEAYVECSASDQTEREYDINKRRIKDCRSRLMIEKDTVKIYMTYKKPGQIQFEDIVLLLKNKNDEMSFIDTFFTFEVESGNL